MNGGVYKRVTCPHCARTVDLREDRDKLKTITCKECGHVIKISIENSVYYIDCCCDKKRYREKVGPNKTIAQAALHKRLTEISEKRFLDVKKVTKVRFEDFADQYLEGHCKVNHKAYEKASGSQLKMLKKDFGGKFLDEITPLDIEKYKGERLKKVSPATVNRGLARLKAMYNTAIKWKVFNGPNPVREVRLLKETNHHLRFLEKYQIEKLLAVTEGKTRAIILVAIHTGMRRAELFNLKWRDVDFRQDNICLLETKSGKSRIIPMDAEVKNTLISIRKHPQSEYIFYKADGQPLKDVRSIFELALKKAGIEDFRFHDLRHTFGSQLAMSGVDMNTIRELMGHADLKTTLIYSHLSQDHKKRAMDVLCQKLSPVIASPNQDLPSSVPELELTTA